MEFVRAYARIRPALQREVHGHRLERCVQQQPGRPVLHVATRPGAPVVIEEDGSSNSPDVRSYEFDAVFDESVSTEQLYAAVCRPLAESVLGAVNATVLCYGMTGSGKTFTMLGDKDGPDGLVGLAAQQLLGAAELNSALSIECSFAQLYGTALTDLLDGAALKITRQGGEVIVEGQQRWPIACMEDLRKLLSEGIRRRKVASQKLNSASSRSHAVLTFHVALASGADSSGEGDSDGSADTVAVRCAKLVCVDLAGSERVKESGVSGTALKEAQAINLSLFHLVNVVQSLNEQAASKHEKPQHVSYANSALTLLLSDALGGNSRTAMVATLSPAQEHAAQSSGTCKFAVSCRQIQNSATCVARRRVPRSRPWAGGDLLAQAARRRDAAKQEAKDANARLPWVDVVPGDARCPGGQRTLAGLCCLCYGDLSGAPRGLAVCLHGNPSVAAAMEWLAPPLVLSGYGVVCVDMPGFGGSPEPPKGRMGTRSEQSCEAGGPAEVVVAVLKELGTRRAVLVGYDWGAGIALSMAASGKFRHWVDKIVCMHPAFAKETVKDELRSVVASTLIMWAEDNAFHSWPKFRPLAKKLQEKLGDRYSEYRTKKEVSTPWSISSRSREIVKFLTGLDPLPEAQTVLERPEQADMAADGSSIVRSDAIVFRGDVTESMVRGADAAVAACEHLAAAVRDGSFPRLFRFIAGMGGTARDVAMARFARDLPALDALTPARLEELGLWSPAARRAAEELQALVAGTPRYTVGAELLTPDGVGLLQQVRVDADEAIVEMDGIERTVSWQAVLRLNQRHMLPNQGGKLLLEDGLWADLSSPLLRAELAAVASKLDGIFSNNVAAALPAGAVALDAARSTAVLTMRSCLDITSFAREGGTDRGRDRHRYAKDDVARMAANGEGHCRTLSSCFAPFLWTFADLLCVDPRYCMDVGGRHQWLQFRVRPSLRTFTCDLYRDEGNFQCGHPRGEKLAESAAAIYGSGLELPCEEMELTGRKLTSAALEPTDVCSSLRS